VLVLDEADQMVDMGFLPEIRRILIQLPQSDRQTLLFSATEPIQIRRLAENILKNQVRVQVGKEAPAVKAINGVLGMPVEQRTLADFNYLSCPYDGHQLATAGTAARCRHQAAVPVANRIVGLLKGGLLGFRPKRRGWLAGDSLSV